MHHIMFLISALYPLVLESTICLVCQQAFISLAPSLQRSLKPRMFMRSGQMWPVAAGVTRCGQSWLLHLLCRPCKSLAGSLELLVGPLQIRCTFLQLPCGSSAGPCRFRACPLDIPLGSSLHLSCSFPAVPLQARCRALKIPCRRGSRRLAVPLQCPCGFPAGPPCSRLAVSLQFPCMRSAGQ